MVEKNNVSIHAKEGRLEFLNFRVSVYQHRASLDIRGISAISFSHLERKSRKSNSKIQVAAISLADIEKALRPKEHVNPAKKIPSQYSEFLDLFDHDEAKKLPPLRGPAVDHDLELTPNQDGSIPEIPNRPLYNMSKE